jgi:erythromycin esterase
VRVVTVRHPWFSARVAVRRSDGVHIDDALNTAIIRGEPPGAYRIVVRPPDDVSHPGRLTIQIRDALTPAAIAQRQAELAAWIRATGFSLRTITPTDDDFSDLEPLVAKIGSSRLVMLGEHTHNDGATFLAKARLLRFLHQRLGFDVLAWEGGFLDGARLEQE